MRSRPAIVLRLPRIVHPGETLGVELSLHSAAETPIRFVRVILHYAQLLRRHPSRDILDARDRLRLSAEVAGRGRLAAGVHRYRTSFALPEDLPPTLDGAVAELRCGVRVLVSIPWWLDAEESREVLVRPSITPRPRSEPFTSTSVRQRGAFIEVSLPGRYFAPGDTLTGAVAFGDLAGRQPRALEVALIGVEQARSGGHSTAHELHRISFFRDLTGVDEGREVPFRISVPSGIPPAFSAGEVSLEYALEAVLEHSDGQVVHRVPLIVGPFAPRAEPPGVLPRIGADRWRATWARAGERAGLSLQDEGLRLAGVRAGCLVNVVPADTRSTSGLRARVYAPSSWGLALGVRPRRVLERGGVMTEDDAFNRRFRVSGRDEAQVRAALSPALRAALSAFRDVDLNDAGAQVWSAATASDERVLAAFLEQVEALAQAVADTGATLPPPAAMAAWLPAWRRFAEESDGVLEVGAMRLSGVLDGAEFRVETRFKGPAPAGTHIALRMQPPWEESGSHAAVRTPRPDPSRTRTAAGIVAAILEQAARLGKVVKDDIEVLPDAIGVEVAAPLAEPAATREVLRPMLALARAMRGERRGGPYR